MNELNYMKFTQPSRRDKAVNSLEGIIKGILADDVINSAEIARLEVWIKNNHDLLLKPPFKEVLSTVRSAIEDGEIDTDEYDEIMWVINNVKLSSSYYDSITQDIQELHGILYGIIADKEISVLELEVLQAWLTERDHLKGIYPYDEIESLVLSVLADGVVSEDETKMLMAFFDDFILLKDTNQKMHSGNDSVERSGLSLMGICAVDPDIQFEGRKFVFTGTSQKTTRKEISKQIEERNGIFLSNLSKECNYLVVGNGGNPAWAFSVTAERSKRQCNFEKQEGLL